MIRRSIQFGFQQPKSVSTCKPCAQLAVQIDPTFRCVILCEPADHSSGFW